MLTIFHHPFCPHSRYIRLALAEYGLEYRTIEERVWERRQEFLIMNPAATTPVLVAEGYPPVPGAATITEFIDEIRGPLVLERFYKRLMRIEQGGGPPDTDAIRAARINVKYHLSYIGWLVRTRDWLAGANMTFADLAAAAHISAVDYLGDVPWNEDEAAKNWYARVKSRPSFRPILAETWPGPPRASNSTTLDF